MGTEAAINTGLSYALLAFISIYPLCMQTFLYKRRDSLKQEGFRKRFGSAYDSLDEKKNRFLIYPLFSFYRKLFICMSIILAPTIFIAQYFILTITSIAIIILIGNTLPFKKANRNRSELFYESYIIFFMYHILCFTDFVPEEGIKNYVGYSAITCLLLHCLCFYVGLLYFTIRGLTRRCKRKIFIKK